ncbi:MAG: TetR/AcrR family transcriptional regulator [Clostridia bacterium]|nr:TetR/AcrR family transcriptional regulator [Clostridia bacterium]
MQYQKEDVRKRIVEAAKTEFLRVGFARTSMLAVSNRAKVPIGNLYRYFSSKAALFDAIVGTAKERLIECAKEICALNIEGLESGKESIIDMANVVGDCLADYAQDYSKELILLLEKSGGSAYADFTNEIIVFASDLCKQRFYTDPLKRNDYLC